VQQDADGKLYLAALLRKQLAVAGRVKSLTQLQMT